MKIVRYKRKGNGQYCVFLENGREYTFFEEVILKHELLLKKKITEEEIKDILLENREYEAYYTALNLIKRLPKSKNEVEEYLKGKNFEEEKCKNVIHKLEKQGYLNDLNYAKSYVHNRIISTKYGPLHISRDLQKKKIPLSMIEEALLEYDEGEEVKKVTALVEKAIRSNHNKSRHALKRKLELSLKEEGFSSYIIVEALSNIKVENEELLARREYDKIYKRLSRKYSGKELEYKVKQKMYQLGFSDFSLEKV